MLVRSWMTPDPPVVTLTTNVDQAYEMLLARRVRVLPLADDSGRLLGVVNERDLLRSASHPRCPLGRCLSPMVLRRTTRRVSVDDTIDHAVRIFCEEDGVTALPVVDHDRVAGILTRRTAMHALAFEHGWTPRGAAPAGSAPRVREGEPMGTPRSYPPPPPCVFQG